MTGMIVLLAGAASLFAAGDPLLRVADRNLTAAQRMEACREMEAKQASPSALRLLLADDTVRACVADRLREVRAVEQFRDAVTDKNPDIRALAARELGAMRDLEALAALEAAATDANLMVATSAAHALAQYEDRRVVPVLSRLAQRADMAGLMALSRLAALGDASAVAIARKLLDSPDVPVRLTALRIIGDQGDASDLPRLRQIAGKHESLSARGRGFGLLPSIDVARAAETAIERIESLRRSVEERIRALEEFERFREELHQGLERQRDPVR